MGALFQDARFALRRLAKSPAFATIAILTLALGIGANVAIFTVVNAVLIHPLPYPQPDRLVRVMADLNGVGVRDVGLSEPELEDLRGKAGVFNQVTALWPVSAALTGGIRPERIEVLVTSPDYFHLLGVHAAIGRVYGPEDAVPGFSDAVVISDGVWRRQFGADPGVLGRRVVMDTDTYTVVGVMPPDFRHPGETVQGDVDMWSACGFSTSPFVSPPQRGQNFIPGAMGRLKPGMTLEQASARLDALAAQLRATYPKDYSAAARWALRLEPVQQNLTGKVRPILSVLLVAVGFVLIIACVNIANLLLARSSGRMREIAVRRALGASRGRIIRQLLTESVLLSLAGGIAAILFLAWLKNWLLAMVPADLPRVTEIQFDARIVGFAFLLSLLTGILFGLFPALQVSAVNPGRDLKEAGRGGGSSIRQNRFRNALVSAEIALSLVLLIGAGLLIRSFWGMLQVNPGFDPRHVAVTQIWIPVPNDPLKNPYGKLPQRNAFLSEVLRRVNSLPGVDGAAFGSGYVLPFTGGRNVLSFRFVDDSGVVGTRNQAEFDFASPHYFEVLKAPLRAGREFTSADSEIGEQVTLVNESFAKSFSPGRNPVGRSILTRGNKSLRIVGVIGDIHDNGLDTPVVPRLYFPIYQVSGFAVTVFFRTAQDPRGLYAAVAQSVHDVDPTLPVFGQRTMEDLLAASEVRRKFVLRLMEAFAGVALLLAALGTYGVMSYAVSQRTQEIGVRVALGARRRDIIKLIVGPGIVLALAGIFVGLVSALLLTQLMVTLLFAVKTTDWLTYASVSLLLLLVSLAACYVPARRATKVDPIIALRYE
jgi:predicted permease